MELVIESEQATVTVKTSTGRIHTIKRNSDTGRVVTAVAKAERINPLYLVKFIKSLWLATEYSDDTTAQIAFYMKKVYS